MLNFKVVVASLLGWPALFLRSVDNKQQVQCNARSDGLTGRDVFSNVMGQSIGP